MTGSVGVLMATPAAIFLIIFQMDPSFSKSVRNFPSRHCGRFDDRVAGGGPKPDEERTFP